MFDNVGDAIRAEKILKNNGYHCRLVAPPPALRRGCDLALDINLVEQAVVARLLSGRVPYVTITPLTGTAELIDVVQTYRYDGYTMVKAGNMKLTFEDGSGVIVNISGGGCPDIPYLHLELLGRRLDQIPQPRELGHTLCALMLDRAVEGALEIWGGSGKGCC